MVAIAAEHDRAGGGRRAAVHRRVRGGPGVVAGSAGAEPGTGVQLWKRFLEANPSVVSGQWALQPVAEGNRLLVPTGSRLVALDLTTGATKWQAVAAGAFQGTVAAADGVAAWLTQTSGGGVVRFLDAATGRERARSGVIPSPEGLLALAPGAAYVGTDIIDHNGRKPPDRPRPRRPPTVGEADRRLPDRAHRHR